MDLWGFPLMPTLAIRKLVLIGKRDQGKIFSTGLTRSLPGLQGAWTLARLERRIPHNWLEHHLWRL